MRERFKFSVNAHKRYRRQFDPWTRHFFCWGDDFGDAEGDDLAVLIGDRAVELEALLGVVLFRDGEGGDDGVADDDRAAKAQVLVEVDGAGAGQLGTENGGDQGTAPHTGGDNLFEG